MKNTSYPKVYTGGSKTIKAKEIAIEIVNAALDKKAVDPVILEVKDFSDVTDYYVICSAESQRGVKTVADNIEKRLKELGVEILGKEGYSNKDWVLIDTPDVVVHIFNHPSREFYDLEGLWFDCPRIDLAPESSPAISGN